MNEHTPLPHSLYTAEELEQRRTEIRERSLIGFRLDDGFIVEKADPNAGTLSVKHERTGEVRDLEFSPSARRILFRCGTPNRTEFLQRLDELDAINNPPSHYRERLRLMREG